MLNKQTFASLFFAAKSKELKKANTTKLKAEFQKEMERAFREYVKENKPKKSKKLEDE